MAIEAKVAAKEEKATKTEVAKAEKPAKAVEGEVVDMVTVTVPKAFILRPDHFQELKFNAGVQKMERQYAEHWWSKANGVEIFED